MLKGDDFMKDVNYDLATEILLLEAVENTVKELKEHYKNHPYSKKEAEQRLIPYLEQQIECLRKINKFKIDILKHFLYDIKRKATIFELDRINGSLKFRLKLCMYIMAISASIIATNNYKEREESLKKAEEQHKIMNDLSDTIEEVTHSIGEKLKEEERIKKEKEEKAKKLFEEKIKTMEEARINECENYLQEYCSYFNFDSEKVITIARNLTNNFENEIIIAVGNKEVVSNSNETMAMFLVWDLYKNSTDYSLTREELTISDEINHLNYNEEGNIILRNGLTFSQFMGKVSDSVEGDRSFTLAVSNLESKKQTSDQAIENNNFGGWRYTEEYLTFPSPEAGVIYHCMMFEKKCQTWNYANIYEFSGLYTQKDKTKPNYTWVENVLGFQHIILANEDEYFDYEEEKEYEKENIIKYKRMLAMNNFVDYPIF